jgi:Tfp pilus assembly protein FimT
MKNWRTQRAGLTLLEVAVIVTLSSLLMALAMMLFSALLHAQRQTLLRERARREFVRLDAMLRNDAHMATSAKLAGEDECELLGQQGNRWTYRADDGSLVREHIRDEQVRQREQFYLSPGAEVKFGEKRIGSRILLQLQIKPPQIADRVTNRLPGYTGQMLVGGMQPVALPGDSP